MHIVDARIWNQDIDKDIQRVTSHQTISCNYNNRLFYTSEFAAVCCVLVCWMGVSGDHSQWVCLVITVSGHVQYVYPVVCPIGLPGGCVWLVCIVNVPILNVHVNQIDHHVQYVCEFVKTAYLVSVQFATYAIQ